MKCVKLILMILALFSLVVGLSSKDKDLIWDSYHSNKGLYDVRWNAIPRAFFDIYFGSAIFTNVSKILQYDGFDENGFDFRCEYVLPETGKKIVALLKFLPEIEGQKSFDQNMFLAELGGTPSESLSNQDSITPYTFDPSLMKVKVNLRGFPRIETTFIVQFLEMQLIDAQDSDKTMRMTVLVVETNLQNLRNPMFDSSFSRGPAKNTDEFLRIYLEFCRGAEYINSENVLHGDHRPDNLVLREDEDGIRRAAIQGFYQSVKWGPDFDGFDEVLRFSRGTFLDFAAPSIEEGSKPKSDVRGSTEEDETESGGTLYSYSKKRREDTYAAACMFEELVQINFPMIQDQDPRIKNIRTVIQKRIFNLSFFIWKVPTTSEWTHIVESLIFAGDQGSSLVRDFCLPDRDAQMEEMSPVVIKSQAEMTPKDGTVRTDELSSQFQNTKHLINLV